MRIFPFYCLMEQVRSANTNSTSSFIGFDGDLIEVLDRYLFSHKINGDTLELRLSNTFAKWPVPWCIVLYPMDLRLAGHISEIRQTHNDICKFTSYEVLKGRKMLPGEIPGVGLLFFPDKGALTLFVTKSPQLVPIGETLADLDENGHWLIICDAPDRNWLEQEQIGDDERYLRNIHL